MSRIYDASRTSELPLNGDDQILVDTKVDGKGRMCQLYENVEEMQYNQSCGRGIRFSEISE